MQRYKFLCVGALQSDKLVERNQTIRQRYDPVTTSIGNPHVILAGVYWRGGPATPESEADSIHRLKSSAALIPCFDLILGGIAVFLPASRQIIYLGIERTSQLLSSLKALLDFLGGDANHRYLIHLTLAIHLKKSAAQDMLDDLRGGDWDI
jgi:2'-5' RNA ligase